MQPANTQIEIVYRPARSSDEPLLRELYALTRATEMAMVPWSDEQREMFIDMQFKAQQEHYRKAFSDATHDILLVNGSPVGNLYVQRRSDEIKIIDLNVLPSERKAGIGNQVVLKILNEAREEEKSVSVYVDTFSGSLQFFKRLGFEEAEQTGAHVQLRWFPPKAD